MTEYKINYWKNEDEEVGTFIAKTIDEIWEFMAMNDIETDDLIGNIKRVEVK